MRKLLLMVVLGVAAMATLGVGAASANTPTPSCNGGSCAPWSTST